MTKLTRRLVVAGAFAVMATPAFAKDPVYTSLLSNVAASGYDVVSYFTEGAPVEGSKDFTAEHDGAEWRFSSAANRDAFIAAPEEFAPQYGGYCAYAVSKGYTASTDPEAWSIAEGKLYLNYSKSVRERWLKDVPGHISSADANWPGVLN